MKRIKAGRHILISGLVIAILLMTLSICTVTAFAAEQESSSGKHLVIKVVEEEEEVLDIKDSEVPLAAFPGFSKKTQADQEGSLYIVLMAVMLVSAIGFVFYRSRGERRLSRLRQKNARARYLSMVEHGSFEDWEDENE